METESLTKFVARRLREIRNAKGLSQKDLEEFGISQKYYQRIEAGKVNLTLRSLEKVASALGVKAMELFQVARAKKRKFGS